MVEGGFDLSEDVQLFGMVTGDCVVPAGRTLVLQGTVSGDLLVEADGLAHVHGTVGGRLIANGTAVVSGVVVKDAAGAGLQVLPGAVIAGVVRKD